MRACNCSEKNRPMAGDLPPGSNERPRQWFVIMRNRSNSYRDGGWSEISVIACRVCGGYWKSKAKFVDKLKDDEFFPYDTAPPVPAFELETD